MLIDQEKETLINNSVIDEEDTSKIACCAIWWEFKHDTCISKLEAPINMPESHFFKNIFVFDIMIKTYLHYNKRVNKYI
jgi:hypothetical protein